ncbi:MAG: hypothetical protein M3444_06340 [Acidobacteriota bacterium]|nr:hypothetical protein [Acidobacteriota bacterium]
MKPRLKRVLLIAPLALLGMALFVIVGGEVVKLLWNWLLPPLFSVRQVNFWQALGLLLLCRILFGGFGLHGGSPRSRARRLMRKDWARLTPEERERFRQRMRERWGGDPPAGEGDWR